MSTIQEDSRKAWTSGSSLPDINAGSLQRIAAATEAMAVNHIQLQRQRDMYEQMYRGEMNRRRAVERQLSAAKGQITKLRNAAQRVKEST